MTDTIKWKLFCFIILASCSTAYPIEGYTSTAVPAMWKTQGESFDASCPNGWTLTRNTSEQVESRCAVGWGRMYDLQCGIGYLYFWDTGVYWCENEQGTVANLFNLTVITRSVSTQERAPFEDPVKLTAVQKFYGERFVMLCPTHSNWTVMRNTSKTIRSKCEVGGHRRKMYGYICHITHLYPWHAGLYWCENKHGTVANLLSLTVTAEPLILQPSAVPIVDGEDVILTCRTRKMLGDVIEEQDRVRFYKNNVLVEERSGRRMSIHNFSSVHAGFYKCGIKTLMSRNVWLDANKPTNKPTVNATTSPLTNRLTGSLSATVNGVPVSVNHVIIVGTCQSLVLSCNNGTNSSEEMTVWAIRVAPFKGTQRCGHGAWGQRRGNVCDIDCVFPWDSGLYFCKSNQGESEAPLGLTVTITDPRKVPPASHVVMQNHGSWQVPEGEEIRLSCKATKCLGNWTVWMRTAQGETRCGTTKGVVSQSVCYMYPNWDDTGYYWCSSEDGRYSLRSTLTVVGVDSVTMSSTVPVVIGDDVALTCRLGSSDLLPETKVVFYKDTEVIATLPRGYMVIRNFTDALHKGYYKCEIPGYGESQYNLVTVEAEGDICEMYNPGHLVAPGNPTTPTPTTPPVVIGLDRWSILLYVMALILIVCLWWIALWMLIRRPDIGEH